MGSSFQIPTTPTPLPVEGASLRVKPCVTDFSGVAFLKKENLEFALPSANASFFDLKTKFMLRLLYSGLQDFSQTWNKQKECRFKERIKPTSLSSYATMTLIGFVPPESWGISGRAIEGRNLFNRPWGFNDKDNVSFSFLMKCLQG